MLDRTHGIARIRHLKALGFSRGEIERAVLVGEIHKIRGGVLAKDPKDPVARAALHGGALACVSVLKRAGVWLMVAPMDPHVALGSNGRVHAHEECTCVEHRDGTTRPLGLVSVRDALRQASRCLTKEQFFAALESAMNLRLVNAREVAWLRARVPASLKVIVGIARWNAESGLESILRLRLWFLGYELQSQVVVPGVGRVDFLIGRVIIEADGRENHAGDAHRHKDHVRDAAARAAGYRVLRFDFRMIMFQWDLVEAALLSVLAR